MKKVLFLIHDLGPGGAEKVLVNLVNNMDNQKYDITVLSIFDVGVNKQFLKETIHYKYCFKRMFRGNSHLMKLFSPRQLHRWLIKEQYDVEISYLEGPCARIISGCEEVTTKIMAWIHIEQHTRKNAAASFRSAKEAENCYNRFDRINCVSKAVQEDFSKCLDIKVPMGVVYNTNESDRIIRLATENVDDVVISKQCINLVGVGKLLKNKGFDRILCIVSKLIEENYPVHLYLLGEGPEETNLRRYIGSHDLEKYVDILGYQINPYKYIGKCDLFVCASYQEGFSTAATEALIIGIPVCTVEVSGMQEMLGPNNEFGVVVPNHDIALYEAIKDLVSNQEKLSNYKMKAIERGKIFNSHSTVRVVEKLIDGDR